MLVYRCLDENSELMRTFGRKEEAEDDDDQGLRDREQEQEPDADEIIID